MSLFKANVFTTNVNRLGKSNQLQLLKSTTDNNPGNALPNESPFILFFGIQ